VIETIEVQEETVMINMLNLAVGCFSGRRDSIFFYVFSCTTLFFSSYTLKL